MCLSAAPALIWCCLFLDRADTSPNIFLRGGGFPAFLDVLAAAVRLVGVRRRSRMVLEPEHRASMRRQAQPYRSRSLSPRAPYLWQDREVDVPSVERRSRKGWYRVDYGPEKSDEVLYLPSFKDRMNFLERSVNRATSEPRIRATSVPPLTVDVRRTKALSIDPIVRDPYRWRTWPFYYHNYRRPYSNYYDMYWPTLGPYSGRIWRLPWYRYPSSPLTTSTAWRYVSPRGRHEDYTTRLPASTAAFQHPLPSSALHDLPQLHLPSKPASLLPLPRHATPRRTLINQCPLPSFRRRRRPLPYPRHVPGGYKLSAPPLRDLPDPRHESITPRPLRHRSRLLRHPLSSISKILIHPSSPSR